MNQDQISAAYSYSSTDKFFFEDLEKRHLFINGEINDTVIDDVAYYILRYNDIDRGKPENERKPIVLYINSPGGEIVPAFGLIDTMLVSKTPIHTVNIGECSSAGFLIYIAGTKRFAMPHSEFLLHDGFTGGVDSMAKLRDRIEFETGELVEEMRDYVLSRTKIDRKLYDKKYRIEWYFLPKKAVELGVADYIIGSDECSIDDI